MKDQKVSTILGTIILMIIAATVATFTLFCIKNSPVKTDVVPAVVQQRLIPSNEKKQESNVEEDVDMQKEALESFDEWNECRNEKFGYTINYPKEWIIANRGIGGFQKINQCNLGRLFFYYFNESSNQNPSFLTIDVSDVMMEGTTYEGSKSLADYFSKVHMDGKFEYFVLDGEQAVRVENNLHSNVFVYHNNKIFHMYENNLTEQLFEFFLKTFKFLD